MILDAAKRIRKGMVLAIVNDERRAFSHLHQLRDVLSKVIRTRAHLKRVANLQILSRFLREKFTRLQHSHNVLGVGRRFAKQELLLAAVILVLVDLIQSRGDFLLLARVLDALQLNDHLAPVVAALVLELVDGQGIKQLVSYNEHRLDLAGRLLQYPLAVRTEKTVPRAGLILTTFVALFRLFGLELLVAQFLKLGHLPFDRPLVECLQVGVPRDAEVEILVVEALDLDFGRVAAGALALAHPRLDGLEVVGEEDVLPLLELVEHSLLLLLDQVGAGLDQGDVHISERLCELGNCPEHVSHHEA